MAMAFGLAEKLKQLLDEEEGGGGKEEKREEKEKVRETIEGEEVGFFDDFCVRRKFPRRR